MQVQSKKPRAIALPVKLNRVYALPLRSPLIQQIFRQPPVDNQLIAAVEEGETLRLVGTNFRAPVTRVTMDGVTGTIASLSDNQLDVVVPPGTLKIALLQLLQGDVVPLRLRAMHEHQLAPGPGGTGVRQHPQRADPGDG